MATPDPDPKPKKSFLHRRGVRLSRDAVLFTAGLLGILHETVIQHGERPSLLLLFAAMCGLPAFFRRNGI